MREARARGRACPHAVSDDTHVPHTNLDALDNAISDGRTFGHIDVHRYSNDLSDGYANPPGHGNLLAGSDRATTDAVSHTRTRPSTPASEIGRYADFPLGLSNSHRESAFAITQTSSRWRKTVTKR